MTHEIPEDEKLYGHQLKMAAKQKPHLQYVDFGSMKYSQLDTFRVLKNNNKNAMRVHGNVFLLLDYMECAKWSSFRGL